MRSRVPKYVCNRRLKKVHKMEKHGCPSGAGDHVLHPNRDDHFIAEGARVLKKQT